MLVFKGVDYFEKDSLLSEEKMMKRVSKCEFMLNDSGYDITVYSAFV
ncbi:MAG: hypothetical protein WCA84_19290 [Ignavibacteriaceae bacterium]